MTGPGRLGRAFAAARRERRGAFVPFLTSGFPDLVESDRLALALCEEGADVLELGVPFSDPIADGPVIQSTTEAALEAGTTLAHVLGQTMRLKGKGVARKGREAGDLYVHFQIVLPTADDAELEKAVDAIAKHQTDDPRAKIVV